MPSAQDIVGSAFALKGAPYRQWQPGNSIPMWRDDPPDNLPLFRHLLRVGVMGSDLINYALQVHGLPPGGGTGSFANYLVNKYDFDPSSPGQQGAIALRPYQGPNDDGSIALYVGPHQLIQSIPGGYGVTDQYDDVTTYGWASSWPRYGFTIYGFLPGVSY